MTDIFVSYARSTEAQALRVADALRALGYGIWRDDEIPAHRAYTDVIEERLKSAKAVVVIWSADAARSEWVRSEAESARADHKLIQLTVDGAKLPMPFDQTQCANLKGWTGEVDAPGWRKVLSSIDALLGPLGSATPESSKRKLNAAASSEPLLAVLPFDNLSRDDDLVYFADGISEEILETVARTTHLKVVGRCSSFQFRGAAKSARKVAAELNCTHVLDGSLRRDGQHVRIGAHLIECDSQTTLWSDRFDRDLSDVFAVQDEIAAAVAAALDHAFAPAPRPHQVDPAAYDLYLRARDASPSWLAARFAAWLGTYDEALLLQAVAKAPEFAKAWAALAMTRAIDRPVDGPAFETWREGVVEAAERALALDATLGTPHAAMANLQPPLGHFREIGDFLEKALAAAPGDPDVLHQVSMFFYRVGRVRDSHRYAAQAYEIDPLRPQSQCWHAMMLLQTGRQDEAFELFDRGMARSPAFDMFADFPMMDAASRGDWATVDRIFAKIPADQPPGAHRAPTLVGVNALRAGPAARQAVLELLRGMVQAEGALAMNVIPFGPKLDLVDDTYDLIEQSDYAPLWKPGAHFAEGDPGTLLLFERTATALRGDPRFVGLCHRLGLTQYWQATDRWPDCMDEVAAHYDLKAEASRLLS